MNLVLKHLWEGVLIGIVTSMIVMAFFMPHYAIHHQISMDIIEVLSTYNHLEKTVQEVILDDYDIRIVLFDEIDNTYGTVFNPNLLFTSIDTQEETIFYSSFDYFINNNLNIGDAIEFMGLDGIYGGFYASDHPYGDNFVTIISKDTIQYTGIKQEWTMDDSYRSHPLPRGFRGIKLFYFLIFSGIIYLIYGVVGILVESSINFFMENFIRLCIASITIIVAVSFYGVIINDFNVNTIMWACALAIVSNLFMLPPLLVCWVGKKIYKKV